MYKRQIQNRENIHPGTYLGKGKIEEVKERLWETGATGVVCDDELTPAQLRNLEKALDTKVMDRTMVCLLYTSTAVKFSSPTPRRPTPTWFLP